MFVKVIHNGNEIEVPRFHARRLVDAGKAQWPEVRQLRADDPEQAGMEAEPPAPVVEDAPESPPAPAKQKRKYKRRDMQAEG